MHWCEAIVVGTEKWYTLWPSCNPYDFKCDGGGDKIRRNNNKYLWTSTKDNKGKTLSGKEQWVLMIGLGFVTVR